MLRVDRIRLENGLKLIVLGMPHVHQTAEALMVRAGPRYETDADNGISHMVEHLLFRGTRSRPDSFAFNTAVERLGGEINGLTQRDALTVHVTVPPRNALPALELLGELVTEPRLTGLSVERNVVIEEILDTLDADGNETDVDTLSRRRLWAGHSLGLPVAGTLERVEAFTSAACRAHYERLFVAENAVLCVAGPVDVDAVAEAARRAFRAMPRGRALLAGPAPTPTFRAPIQVQATDASQVSLSFTYPAPHERDRDFPALLLLRRLLDDGLASRLRQAVCERRGLAYSVGASIDAYEDAGAIDLELSASPRKLLPAAIATLKTLDRLVADGVDADELSRVKTRHRAELEFGLDSPAELAGWYGSAELLGSEVGYEARLEQAMAVTADDLVALAGRVFRRDRAVCTLVGPAEAEDVAALEELLERETGSTRWLGEGHEGDEPPHPRLVAVS